MTEAVTQGNQAPRGNPSSTQGQRGVSLISPPDGLTINEDCFRGAGPRLHTILTNNGLCDSWAPCEVECFMNNCPELWAEKQPLYIYHLSVQGKFPWYPGTVSSFRCRNHLSMFWLSFQLTSCFPLQGKGVKHTSIVSENIAVLQQNYSSKRWSRGIAKSLGYI